MSEQKEMQPVGVLHTVDSTGRVHKSSKRLLGSVLIIAGGVLLLAIGVSAIFRQIADQQAAISAGTTLVVTGAALLGVGVLDGIGQALGRGSR